MKIGTRITLTASILVAIAFGIYSFVTLSVDEGAERRQLENQASTLAKALRSTIQHVGFHAFAADANELHEKFEDEEFNWQIRLLSMGNESNQRIRKRLESQGQYHSSLTEIRTQGSKQLFVFLEAVWEITATGPRLVGVIQLTHDLAFLRGQRTESRNRALVTLVVVLGALVFALSLVARSTLSRPIHKLLKGIDGVTQGDLSQALLQERDDEIGDISERFNDMTASLRDARLETQRSVAARLALQGQLRRSEKLATVGQLAAEIAHEVGTPLNVVTGRASAMARRAQDPEAVKKNASIITEQAERITRIIQRLLDFARRGVREVEKEPLNINKLIENSIEAMEDQFQSSRVIATATLEDTLPTIHGHKDQLQQVLLNLFVNSIQAMPQGGKLEVNTGKIKRRRPGLEVAPEQEYALIRVKDSGSGVSDEHRKRIFDPFYTTKEESGGTGLGLAVSQGIVKDHDGWLALAAESPDKGGAEFHIYLPFEESNEKPAENASNHSFEPGHK